MKMVERLKAYQKILGETILAMRDIENDMDNKRPEFMSAMHKILPEDQTSIKSLKEFNTFVSAAKSSKFYNRIAVDQYVQTIQKWREYYQTLNIEVITPLLQIHKSCENAEQREIKTKILQHVEDMQRYLKRDNDLQTVKHVETEKKIARRDTPLFLGLLSLVPLGADKVADIDILIDDYMRHYKLEEEL